MTFPVSSGYPGVLKELDRSSNGDLGSVADPAIGGKEPLRSSSGDDQGEEPFPVPVASMLLPDLKLSDLPKSQRLRLASMLALAPPPTSLKDPDLITVSLLRPNLGLDLTLSTRAWKPMGPLSRLLSLLEAKEEAVPAEATPLVTMLGVLGSS